MKLFRYISRVCRGIICLPQTLYLNFALLPFKDGIKFPIVVMSLLDIQGLSRKNFKIEAPIKTGMIRIGALKTSKRGINVNRKTSLIIDKKGHIVFKGSASIGKGSSICASGGTIVLGDKFSCNANCFIYSQNEIVFNNDVLLGWDINIRDNDGHPLYDSKHNLVNAPSKVHLKDHVWVASYVDILKGCVLEEGVIVGTRSLVTKSISDKNVVVAGIPAKVVKRDIFWEHN